MVTIITSDGEKFVLEADVASQCGLIADFASGDGKHQPTTSNTFLNEHEAVPRYLHRRYTNSKCDFNGHEKGLTYISMIFVRLNVDMNNMEQVITYCEHHRNDGAREPESEATSPRRVPLEFDEWHKEFINVEQEMLFEIILAANYLNIKPLL